MVKRLSLVVVLACIAACGSPVAPTRTVTITVKALAQRSDAPLAGAHVFVDEQDVAITPSNGAVSLTVPNREVSIRVEYRGVRSIAGPVTAHPGNGEVWTFWFEARQ